MEIRSRGQVRLIGRDIAGDCSITSGDMVRRVGDGLGCHGYDRRMSGGEIPVE